MKRSLGRHGRPSRGYTVVELIMATSIFALGVMAIIALQKVTIAANQHSKDLAIASRIAQSWQEMLTTDSVRWNHPSVRTLTSDIGDTTWLKEAGNPGAWFQPVYDQNLQFGPAFDALGNPVALPDKAPQANFCTHVRLTYLYPPDEPVVGNALIRAEVRVFWRRPGANNLEEFCSINNDADEVGENVGAYYFVYKTASVRQNTRN